MSSPTTPEIPSVSNLQEILKELPACLRCRRNKKRCDPRLPACVNCTRAEQECLFHDRTTSDILSRTHIASLVEQFENSTSKAAEDSLYHQETVVHAHLVSTGNTTRYLGSQAALNGPAVALSTQIHESSRLSWELPASFSQGWSTNPEIHAFLMDSYFEAIHKPFPIFDWPSEFLSTSSPGEVGGGFGAYLRPMVCSIACHCLPGNDPRLFILSDTLYRQALASAETIMSQISIETLQVTILLAIRSLFDPRAGSLGQQIAFARSLTLELTSRGLFRHSPLELPIRRTLFCLDNLLGSVLDRPSEPVATAVPDAAGLSNQTAFLALQYEEQWRYRNNLPVAQTHTRAPEPPPDRRWSSLAYTTQRETSFLIHPSTSTALDLLQEYCRPDTILTVFTSHWTLKASLHLLHERHPQKTWYLLAFKILDRSCLKWPETDALQDCLSSMLASHSSADE